MIIGITGATGYIAGRLLTHHLFSNEKIVKIARNEAGGVIWPEEPPDIVVHLAAMTNLYQCEQSPDKSIASNVSLTAEVARRCAETGAALIFASSETADDRLGKARSVYDLHKRIAEDIVMSAKLKRSVVLRLATVYGASESGSAPGRGIINKWVKDCLSGRRITVYNMVADKSRNYVHITDVADAFARALFADSGIYAVGTEKPRTILAAADIIAEIARGEVEIVPTPASIHPIDLRSDAQINIGDWLPGWMPRIEFREGITRTADWYAWSKA